MALLATNNPGEFAIPELGRIIRLTEWEEKDIYDTVALANTTSLDGNIVEFFLNVQAKRDVDTNLRTAGKMPARHELICMKPGVFVQPLWGNIPPTLFSQLAIYAGGLFSLEKNAKAQVSRTHLWRMQTGYGMVAYGLDVAGAATSVAPSSLGVASPAAIPPLLIPFVIQPEDDFDVEIRFEASGAATANTAGVTPVYAAAVLDADTAIKTILHGFVKSPASK